MKYIIEIEDEPFGRNDDPVIPHGMDELWRAKGFRSLVFDKNGLEKLTPLNDIEDLQRSAYQKGYEAGFAEGRKRTELSMAQEEITVGDEVEFEDLTGVVTRRYGESTLEIMCTDGALYDTVATDEVRKTGRYFPQLIELFKEMNYGINS